MKRLIVLVIPTAMVLFTVGMLVLFKPGMKDNVEETSVVQAVQSTAEAHTEKVETSIVETVQDYITETNQVVVIESESYGKTVDEVGDAYASDNPQEYVLLGPTGDYHYYELPESVFKTTDWLDDLTIFEYLLLEEDDWGYLQLGDIVINEASYMVTDTEVSVGYTFHDRYLNETYDYVLIVDRVHRAVTGDV